MWFGRTRLRSTLSSAHQQCNNLRSAGISRSIVYTGRKINCRVVSAQNASLPSIWSLSLWDHMDGSHGCDAANAASLDVVLPLQGQGRSPFWCTIPSATEQRPASHPKHSASLRSQPDLCASDVNSSSTDKKVPKSVKTKLR